MALGLFILYCGVLAVSGSINKYLSALERTILGIIQFLFCGPCVFAFGGKKAGVQNRWAERRKYKTVANHGDSACCNSLFLQLPVEYPF